MKFLILIFLSPVLFTPGFAEQTRYRLQRNGVAKLQTGWVLVDEQLKGYVDSKIHPGYGFSDTAVKNGTLRVKNGILRIQSSFKIQKNFKGLIGAIT